MQASLHQALIHLHELPISLQTGGGDFGRFLDILFGIEKKIRLISWGGDGIGESLAAHPSVDYFHDYSRNATSKHNFHDGGAGNGRNDGFTHETEIEDVLAPIREHAEGSFDIAVIHPNGFRSDCLDAAKLLVREGGVILVGGISSWSSHDSIPENGRLLSEVITGFQFRQYFDAAQILLLINESRGSSITFEKNVKTKIRSLHSIFEAMEEAGVEFLTLRNFSDIPLFTSIGNDIDILIRQEDFDRAMKVFSKLGYLHKVDQNIEQRLYSASPHHHFYLPHLDIHIDVVLGLNYRSLNGSELVAVHTGLQESVFERRRRVVEIWQYIPSLNDFVIHLLCHSIYDKQSMKSVYKRAIEEAWLTIQDKDSFHSELESLFFKFAPVLVGLIEKRRTEFAYDTYLGFTDY